MHAVDSLYHACDFLLTCIYTGSGSSRITSSIPTLGPQSMASESLSSIFNWNPGNTVGQKRKGLDQRLPKKRKALPMWTHIFICLSNKDANSPPDMQERASLQIAGLGEKRVSFNIYADQCSRCVP